MNRKPKYSIIIPAYNAERFLASSIISALNQDYNGDYEIIVVNDGSTDGTLLIAEKFVSKHDNVSCLTINNSGPLLARRFGVSKALGEYLVFLDADDCLNGQMLSTFDRIQLQTNADIISCNFSRKKDYSQNENIENLANGFYSGEKYNLVKSAVCKCEANTLWGRAIRRKCFDIDSDYSDYAGLVYAEDLFQLLPIIDNASSYYKINLPLYYYRADIFSSTSRYSRRQLKNLEIVSNRLHYFAASWGEKASDIAFEGEMHLYINLYKVSELSSATVSEKRIAFNEISSSMVSRKIFDNASFRWARIDNRLLLWCLKRRRFFLAHVVVSITQKIKSLLVNIEHMCHN